MSLALGLGACACATDSSSFISREPARVVGVCWFFQVGGRGFAARGVAGWWPRPRRSRARSRFGLDLDSRFHRSGAATNERAGGVHQAAIVCVGNLSLLGRLGLRL
jgi:hypothetical protein